MNTKVTYQTVITQAVDVETIYRKGGSSVASALLALAIGSNSGDDFRSSCAAAEKWLKSDEAGAHQLIEGSRLPRCWIQAKSDIAAGLEQGLNPKDYSTYASFKKAKVEAGKAIKEVAKIGTIEKDGLREAVLSGSTPMSGPMADLVKLVAKLSDQKASSLIANWTQQAKSAVHKQGAKGHRNVQRQAA